MLGKLTKREREIAELVAQGHSNKGIAEHLGVTEQSVAVALVRIYSKLGITCDAEIKPRVLLARMMWESRAAGPASN